MGVEIVVKGATYSSNLNSVFAAKSLANKYITDAVITDSVQQKAIRDFVSELSLNNVLPKLTALWLFTGDTYAKVKFNLINTSLYTLSTIDVSKIANGLDLTTLGQINTNFRGDAAFLQDGHISFYNSNVETQNITIPIHDVTGSEDGSGYMFSRALGTTPKVAFGLKELAPITALKVVERGLFLGSHSSNLSSVYSKGVLIQSAAKTNTGSPLSNLTIGTSSIYKSAMKLQLASVGTSLNATEALAYSNACESFTTALGR